MTVGEVLSMNFHVNLWIFIDGNVCFWHHTCKITIIKMYCEEIKELQQLHRENSQVLYKLERDLARVKGVQVNPKLQFLE